MALDKEQQARLTFLAEAETYFGEIEAVLLGLKTAEDRASQINIAMRAAHSVKGTAGMMGFEVLSQVAHNLEDSFKILRARQLSMDSHLETLLLQGVDCLRIARQHYHGEQPIPPQWLTNYAEPIFAQLKERLGDLTPEDEARLLSEDNNANLDYVIFTTSVEDTLEEFEQELPQLRGEDLRQAIINLARQMCEFGLMAQLAPFVSLCESVQQECTFADLEVIDAIAHQAMKDWQRSHSLVLLGRTERLPTQLKSPQETSGQTLRDVAELPLSELLDEPAVKLTDISSNDIDYLQDRLAALNIAEELPQSGLSELGENRLDEPVDLEALQAQFSALPLESELEPVLEDSR